MRYLIVLAALVLSACATGPNENMQQVVEYTIGEDEEILYSQRVLDIDGGPYRDGLLVITNEATYFFEALNSETDSSYDNWTIKFLREISHSDQPIVKRYKTGIYPVIVVGPVQVRPVFGASIGIQRTYEKLGVTIWDCSSITASECDKKYAD